MADRYFVIGESSFAYFEDSAYWSATSGGAGGASVPGAGDTAIFDSTEWYSDVIRVNIASEVLCDFDFDNLDPWRLAFFLKDTAIWSLRGPIKNVLGLSLYSGASLETNDYDVTLNSFLDAYSGSSLDLGGSTVTLGADYDSRPGIIVYYYNDVTCTVRQEITSSSNATLNIYSGTQDYWTPTACHLTCRNVFSHINITVEPGVSVKFYSDNLVVEDITIVGDGTLEMLGGVILSVSNSIQVEGLTTGGLKLYGFDTDEIAWMDTIFKEGGEVILRNCSIKNIATSGGAIFYAPSNYGNVDEGGNIGWNMGEYHAVRGETGVTFAMDGLIDALAEDISVSTAIEEVSLDSISESVDVTTSIIGSVVQNVFIAANLKAITGFAIVYDVIIEDCLQMQEDVQYDVIFQKYIAEELAFESYSQASFHARITEVLFVWEALALGWKVTAEDGLDLSDSLADVLILMISDWITLIDSQTNNWNGVDTINDRIMLYDISEKYLSISDTIEDGFNIADIDSWVLMVAVLESLRFTSLSAGLKTMASTVSENIDLADSPDTAFALLIQEALSVVDAASVIATFVNVIQESLWIAGAATDRIVGFMESISESLSLSGAATVINHIYKALEESLVFSTTVSNQGALYSAIYDTLRLNVSVSMDGEIWECYVLNTPKFMPSMYSGFDFNSYCIFENRAFGANDTGIYELDGDTDAGAEIHTGVVLNQTDFGSRNQKRIRRAYLGISGNSPVMIVEAENGERQVYDIDTQGKTVVSRDLKSKEWKLSIADFEELDTIKLIPVILSK